MPPITTANLKNTHTAPPSSPEGSTIIPGFGMLPKSANANCCLRTMPCVIRLQLFVKSVHYQRTGRGARTAVLKLFTKNESANQSAVHARVAPTNRPKRPSTGTPMNRAHNSSDNSNKPATKPNRNNSLVAMMRRNETGSDSSNHNVPPSRSDAIRLYVNEIINSGSR